MSGNRNRTQRMPLLFFAVAALLAGLWAGLRRLGWELPELRPGLMMAHGPLMVCGFLGTLISLERAVALGRSWALFAPLAAGVGGVLGIAGVGGAAPAWLALAASVLLFVMYLAFTAKQKAGSMVVMMAGSALWLVGNVAWIAGRPLSEATYWWIGFVVLTIMGERYGFSRMMGASRGSKWVFWLSNALILLGIVAATLFRNYAVVVLGVGLILGDRWISRYDISRRTLKQSGLPRYVALSIQSGGVWLGAAGMLMVVFRDVPAGPRYDAIVHAVFVGFAFSMIFGHAPLIFPSVLKVPLPYQPFFYVPLVLLHASLVHRVVSDLFNWSYGRKWGAILNAAAIVLFFASNVASAVVSRRRARKPPVSY
jgi:hypothetical protein